MSDKSFFDEETVDKIREHDKEQIALNKKKGQFNKVNTAMGSYGNYNYENEDLLRTYVGDKYPDFMTKSFNIWAFLFGPFYLLYRKMYLYGFLLTLFMTTIDTYFININLKNSIIVLIFDLVLNLIIGLSFNRLYIGTSINEINRLKKEYPTLDTNELCRNQGGTSIVMAIIIGFVIAILVSLIMSLL